MDGEQLTPTLSLQVILTVLENDPACARDLIISFESASDTARDEREGNVVGTCGIR